MLQVVLLILRHELGLVRVLWTAEFKNRAFEHCDLALPLFCPDFAI